MLESRYRFRTLAFYIRTYHNVTADWVSRENKEVVEEELMRTGWRKVSPAENWSSYLFDALRGVYRWPGDQDGTAKQVRGARQKEAVPHYRPVEVRGNLVEVEGGFLPWAAAWVRLGGQVLILPGEGAGWGKKHCMGGVGRGRMAGLLFDRGHLELWEGVEYARWKAVAPQASLWTCLIRAPEKVLQRR